MPVFLSVIVPLYNEEPVLRELVERLTSVLSVYRDDYEVILVNDGSRDRTLPLAKEFCLRDRKVKLISLSRNFGHQIALTAGMDMASGRVVVTIDADLQDPPEIIPEMVNRWKEGYQVVHGVRNKRKGEGIFRHAAIFLFYRFLRKTTTIDITVDSGDFRLMDRKVVEELKTMRERNRYLRGMVSWVGFRQTELEYVRERRFAGETKYPFRKLARLAADGILSFSRFPLKLPMAIGCFCTLASTLLLLCAVLANLAGPGKAVPVWVYGLLLVVFLGGVQLIAIGMLGQYVGRIYEQTNERPMYVIGEQVNFEPAGGNAGPDG
jgi:glycosyltransferase involved in cell wall biosynthesis